MTIWLLFEFACVGSDMYTCIYIQYIQYMQFVTIGIVRPTARSPNPTAGSAFPVTTD